MKILVLSTLFPTPYRKQGGIFIKKRLEQYKYQNVDFDIFSVIPRDSKLINIIKKKTGGDLFDFKENKIEYPEFTWKFIRIKRHIWDYKLTKHFIKRNTKELLKKINIKNYDIIQAHGALPHGYMAKIIKEKYRIPYTITLHGSDIHTAPQNNKKIRHYTLEVLENAEKCIFVSDNLRKKAVKLGYSNKNSTVIPNGYDSQIFNNKNKETQKNNKTVGFVGNLVEIKNASKLPNIFQKIKEKNENTKFIIVGDGSLRKNLENKIQTKKIDVEFTGRIPQEKVAEKMKQMDIMILPSKNEGWPCVVLEAQACGTYVVGSERGGIPEAIGPYGKTFGLNQNFEKNISSHIIEILKNGYEKQKMIERAKQYTWEKIAKKEIEILNKSC